MAPSGRIRVLNPVGEVKRRAFTAPALPSDLVGKTIGFLDNTKPTSTASLATWARSCASAFA